MIVCLSVLYGTLSLHPPIFLIGPEKGHAPSHWMNSLFFDQALHLPT